MNDPKHYTASVKVMRSHDYCHFEVCLGSTEPIAIEDVDAMRKQAARLADKAVDQYRVAKSDAAAIENENWDREQEAREAQSIQLIPEQDRTIEQKARLKAFTDASFNTRRRRYDYEDDWEQHAFDDEE